MGSDEDRTFHLGRAKQCRQMAAEATDQAVRNLHEQLAQFHEAEAKREPDELASADDEER